MRVVVCGGGAIGASIAYYLSRRGIEVVVVERTGVACAASGKAGAFLALDWLAGTRLDALARRSFALHASLPAEIGADWGYHRLTTHAGLVLSERESRLAARPELDWLADSVVLTGRLGSPATTALVHPAAFTTAMMGAAEQLGAVLRIGQVRGVLHQGQGSSVRGVELDDYLLEADAVVIAMGPWSSLAARWLPLPAVFAHQGHSLLFETGRLVSPDALFVEYRAPNVAVLAPEVFPRADGTTYVAFSSSQQPLPLDPAEVRPDPLAIEQLQTLCERISPALVEANLVARQACYRPVTRDGLPLIGRVPGIAGAYVATGHSVWGVLNAPATGEALAELIVDGEAHSTDLRPFDPARLRSLERPD